MTSEKRYRRRTTILIDTQKLFMKIVKTGLSAKDIAQKIGASASYISNVYSTGKISYRYYIELCKLLEIPESELLIEDDGNPENGAETLESNREKKYSMETKADCLLNIAENFFRLAELEGDKEKGETSE